MADLVGKIIKWESGEMTQKETVEFFAELIKNKMAWSLQGCYGRTANAFIQNGILDANGNITKKGMEALENSEEE